MARRKITPPADKPEGHPQLPNAADLPDLTEKQFNFVRHLISGQSHIAAYRMAYDAQNMTDNSVWVAAWRLKNDTKVSQWLQAAKEMQAQTVTVTLDSHLARLDYLSRKAEAEGNLGAAVQAEQLKGKAVGLYIDRHEDVNKTKSRPEDLLKALGKAGVDKGALAQIGKALGMKAANEALVIEGKTVSPATETVQ